MKGWRMVVIWLGILALAGWAAWRLAQPERSVTGGAALATPSAARVAAVDIRPRGNKGEAVHLRREKGGGWRVRLKDGWKPARGELVERLLRDLTGMRIARVVARGRGHDTELGLTDGVDVALRDASGKVLLSVTVGRQGEDLLSTYCRVNGRSEAVAVDRALVWQVKRPLSGWVEEAPKEETPPLKTAGGQNRTGGS